MNLKLITMNKLTKNKLFFAVEDIAKLITVITFASIVAYVAYQVYSGNYYL